MPATPYDEVAYPSYPFPLTHPLRLALPAALYGLPFAPVETARVLEIGCGEGGNIIPLAVSYPNARFHGFDLAPTAIEAGQATIEALGLTNLRLEQRDILDAAADLGEFDYVIAHGVYSWVPEVVREGLLALMGACLAPEGLGFVSYNALPGCHLRMMIREMLMHHLRNVEGFEARLAGARQFLQLYVDNAPDDDPTSFTVKTYCRSMLAREPRVLFHDELGPVFQPFYIHEFAGDAQRHGLQFLADSEGPWWREELFPSSRGKAVMAAIGSDAIEVHQYLDYFTSRLFRQSILCRAERAVDRRVDYRRARKLWAAGAAKTADADPDLTSGAAVRFELGGGAAIALDHPGLKQALFRIGKVFPAPVAVADLPDDPDVNEGLLQLFTAGHLELTAGPAPSAREAGERPLASPWARLQLSRGQTAVCTLTHEVVSLEDEASRAFLSRLDGAHTREALAELLMNDGRDRAAATAVMETQLTGLARLGLLVS
jgi:SAM-dependent methyltransferase